MVLWQILAGLLKLGNIKFEKKEYVTKRGSKQSGSWPTDMTLIADAAKQLGVDAEELATALTTVQVGI